MVAEAVAADVDIVNPAMNHGSFGTAKVASATNPLRLRLRSIRTIRARLERVGLHVEPSGDSECAQRKNTNAEPENALIGMRPKSCRQEGETKHHQKTSADDCQAADLAHWESLP